MLAEHYRQAGKPDYIATVHRLDKIVGGVMVLSRRREVTGRLTAAIAAHEITKEYLAVLRGHPQEPAATLTDLLFRDASHNKSYVVKRMRKGVREARLSYEEVGRTEELSLVRVQLYTGAYPSDPGAVCLPWAAAAGGYPLRQQGSRLHGGAVVISSGLPASRHREAGGCDVSAAEGVSVGFVWRGKMTESTGGLWGRRCFLRGCQSETDVVESGEKNHCERGSAMQELISALTAHEEECSREFEADLSAFCTRHMDAQLVQQLRQLVAEGEEDLAYRAFYALTIIYRNRKDYQQLQALFEENPRFAGHPSYHHLLILFQLEAETFFDALELLELAREDARQHRDNAGYLHLFAHLFVYTCEKSRGEMREQVRREYYDDVERAVEDAIRLDPAYAKFYCTKARVVAQRGRYGEAYSLINKAVATESSARKDYALRLLDYRHCETVILLQEQREYFKGRWRSCASLCRLCPSPRPLCRGGDRRPMRAQSPTASSAMPTSTAIGCTP